MDTPEYKRLKNMYFSDSARDRKDEILHSVVTGKALPGLYLITFSANRKEQLDIFPAYILLQKRVRIRLPLLAGAAFGRQEAMELVASMASDAYKRTGACHLQEYLLQMSEVVQMR